MKLLRKFLYFLLTDTPLVLFFLIVPMFIIEFIGYLFTGKTIITDNRLERLLDYLEKRIESINPEK